MLATGFRAIGYEVALEELHPGARRVDIVVTVPHPSHPLRYAVEVQNSAIDPREMTRRLLADLRNGFACTAWIFTGSRGEALHSAVEGDEVRVSADVLAAEHVLPYGVAPETRREITEVLGLEASHWLGERLSLSYGTLGYLRGAKYLDVDGQLWSIDLERVTRAGNNNRNARLKSTRRVTRKIPISFNLFGLPWQVGDHQRRQLAFAVIKHVPDDDNSVDLHTISQLAADMFSVSHTPAVVQWTQATLANLNKAGQQPRYPRSNELLRSAARIFLQWYGATSEVPCGWGPIPDATVDPI